VKRILFIRLRLLGDIVFTIPTVQLFNQEFPDTYIYYIVEEKFREIGELLPAIHKLIVIPRKMRLRQMWSFRNEIRSIGFDTVIDLHSGPKSAQLTWLTGASRRIGYRTPNRNWAYTHHVPRQFGDGYTHSVFNQARLLEPLGIQVNREILTPYPGITIDENLLRPHAKEAAQLEKKIILHVGAGNDFRDWGFENFSLLTEQLKSEGFNVCLMGHGSKEQEKAARLAQLHEIHDFTGRLTIAESFHLISNSLVYMGADSGPLHLASLTSTPIVALYGPNIPEISGPWRKKDVTIVRKSMHCQPCDQRTCIYDIIPCMKNITMDEVYEAIIQYIK
jgi:heptosyltransferase I